MPHLDAKSEDTPFGWDYTPAQMYVQTAADTMDKQQALSDHVLVHLEYTPLVYQQTDRFLSPKTKNTVITDVGR